jgi:hypothetical protein
MSIATYLLVQELKVCSTLILDVFSLVGFIVPVGFLLPLLVLLLFVVICIVEVVFPLGILAVCTPISGKLNTGG